MALVLGACGRLDFEPLDQRTADAATSATPWQHASTQGKNLAATTIANAFTADAGDLVIAGCGFGMSTGVPIAFSVTPAGMVTLAAPIEQDVQYMTTVAVWGSVASGAGTGANLTITAANLDPGGADCSVSVYRGGGASPHLVDMLNTTSTVGNALCGPVATQPGGVAYYVTINLGGTNAPPSSAPFQERYAGNGNPAGDWAPTDGTSQSAMLANSGAFFWACTTISLSP